MSITCKQPNAEPTDKQLAFFNMLAQERGIAAIDAFAEGTTRQQASNAIEAMRALPKPGKGKALAPPSGALAATMGVEADDYVLAKAPSLMDLAAQITGQAPPERMAQIAENFAAAKAAEPVAKPEFTDQELSAIRSAISVTIGETDGTPTDHDLYERIDAYLASKGL